MTTAHHRLPLPPACLAALPVLAAAIAILVSGMASLVWAMR